MVYGQLDARWKNKKLGNSTAKDATIGNYGCTLTAITNLHNRLFGTDLKPDEVNELFIKHKAYVLSKGYALVLWANVPKALPKLKWVYRDPNYSNALVWSWINITPRVPVIVVAQTKFAPQHFVLFIGGGKMIDSLDGKEKPTSTYPTLVGSARFTRS